jgi:hypothetical protein
MNLTTIFFTPKNITKGIGLIRQMKSLKTIGPTWDTNKFPPAEFWKKYDAGEFGKPTSAAVPAVRKPITTFNDPAFKQWMKEVAALPAEKQVEAVVKKLQELNPGFDGKVAGFWGTGTPRIENGVVTGVGFLTDNVTDISPVRALERLRSLSFGNDRNHRSKFSDLSPLEGMNLTLLFFTPKNITKGLDVIRKMKSLKAIGTRNEDKDKFPPDVFWKKYDAGEFNK